MFEIVLISLADTNLSRIQSIIKTDGTDMIYKYNNKSKSKEIFVYLLYKIISHVEIYV